MKKQILTFIFALVFLTVLAGAYPVQMNLNANSAFNSTIYHCTNADCSSLSSFLTSNYGNPISYLVPNLGSGTQYFAEYDFVSDRCYVSHSYINSFDSLTGNGPWSYSIQFAKQANCQSVINGLSSPSTLLDNQTLNVAVSAESPLTLRADSPKTTPLSLRYFYSTNVSILVEIRNSSGIIISNKSGSDIVWGTNKSFDFSFRNIPSGNYTIRAISDVNDCMCSNSIQAYTEKTITILSSTQPDTTPPVLSLPSNISANTTNPLGAIVSFTANATDNVDGNVPVICNHASGSFFSSGTTIVTCNATDSSGNTATGSFNIIVTYQSPPQCLISSDCGSQLTLNYFCNGNDVYKNVSTPSCISGICAFSTSSVLNTTCQYGCSAGQCNPSNSSNNLFNITIIRPSDNENVNTASGQTTASIPLILNVTGNTTNFSCNYTINANFFRCPSLILGIINSSINAINGTNILVINASNGNYTLNITKIFAVLFNITNSSLCTNGSSQTCTAGSCAGTQTCSGGAWGACTKIDPNCGNSNGEKHNRNIINITNPEEESNNIPISHEEQPIASKNTSTGYASWAMILLILLLLLSIILLLILIFVAKRRKESK